MQTCALEVGEESGLGVMDEFSAGLSGSPSAQVTSDYKVPFAALALRDSGISLLEDFADDDEGGNCAGIVKSGKLTEGQKKDKDQHGAPSSLELNSDGGGPADSEIPRRVFDAVDNTDSAASLGNTGHSNGGQAERGDGEAECRGRSVVERINEGEAELEQEIEAGYNVEADIIDEGDIIDNDTPLSLTEHLEELRRRILVCLACWVVASCVAYSQVGYVLAKIRDLAGAGFSFVYTSPTEAFMAFIKLAMVVGFVTVLPVILYEFFAFINPGLKRKERRLLFSLVPAGLGLFALGLVFAWFVALPIMWKFFLSFQGAGIVALWTIGEVVGFAAGLLLICGVIFELPLFVIGAVYMEFISYERLAKARRMVYFVIIVLTAVITPTPDAFTCLVVSIPIALLFEVSLLVTRLVRRSDN